MQKKGKFSASDAMKNGMVPAAPVARAIEGWVTENWWRDEHASQGVDENGAAGTLAECCDVSFDLIARLRRGDKQWIEFDNADRIITFIDPWLWRRDPELHEIYESFDFAHLELLHPTCAAADPVPLLDGLTARTASWLLGVGQSSIERARTSEIRERKAARLAA